MKKLLLALCLGLFFVHTAWSMKEESEDITQQAKEKLAKITVPLKIDFTKTSEYINGDGEKSIKNNDYKNITSGDDQNLIRYLYNRFPNKSDTLSYPETKFIVSKFWSGVSTQDNLEQAFLQYFNDKITNITHKKFDLAGKIKDAIEQLKYPAIINMYFNAILYNYNLAIQNNDSGLKNFIVNVINSSPRDTLTTTLKTHTFVFSDIAKDALKYIETLLGPDKEEKKEEEKTEPKPVELKENPEEDAKTLNAFGVGLQHISSISK